MTAAQAELSHVLVESAMRLSEKVPGWHATPRVTYRTETKPQQVIHFKNAACRHKARVALEALKATKSKGDVLTKEELDRTLSPFIKSVPIWRGMLKPQAKAYLTAKAEAEAKETDDEQ